MASIEKDIIIRSLEDETKSTYNKLFEYNKVITCVSLITQLMILVFFCIFGILIANSFINANTTY